MKRFNWWRRYGIGAGSAFLVGTLYWPVSSIARTTPLVASPTYVLVVLVAIAVSFSILFLRQARRLLYPTAPLLFAVGLLEWLLVLILAPSNWIYLGVFLVVFSGFFMHVMYDVREDDFAQKKRPSTGANRSKKR
jgi:hypothetical protein